MKGEQLDNIMSSGSSNAETTRLVLTAVGASFAGAALAIGIMNRMLNNNNNNNNNNSDDQYNSMSQRKRSSSFIFEDPEASLIRPSSAVLFPHNHEEKMRRLVAARAAVDEENSLPRQSVTVRVPATSANMGPGCE